MLYEISPRGPQTGKHSFRSLRFSGGMKQAAIYARVSSERQEEQRTIESQLAALREACQRDGVHVVGEYTDDGLSGATLARPSLDQLRDDVSRGLFQAVYILSPDRLARKYVYQALVLEDFRKQGIQVVFLDKEVTDKPEDQLLLGMQGLIAEYERAQIMERTRRGRLHRARMGEIVSAVPPYGFNYVARTREKPAHYTINEAEAEIVGLVFSLYLKFRSSTWIVKELYRRGIRPRGGGRYWHPCVIHKMLRSESYAGRAYYNKTRGSGTGRDRSDWILIPVPRIIEEETFQLAQRVLDEHRGGKKVWEYLLSRLVRCKYCGSAYVGNLSNHGNTPYYRCANRRNRFPQPPNCFAKLVRAERLERAVIAAVKEAVSRPEVLSGHLQKLAEKVRERAKGAGNEIEGLKRKRTSLEEKSQKLLDLYLEGDISREEYAIRKEGLETTIRELEEKVVELQREVPQLDEETVRQSIHHFCRVARERLEGLGPVEMQQFLRLLIEEVVYDWQKGEAIVRGHIPVGQDSLNSLCRYPGIKVPANRDNVLPFEMAVRV